MSTCVLLTGGEGFLGRHIAQRFAADGHRAVSVGFGDLTPAEQAQFGITGIYRDAIDARLLSLAAKEHGAPAVVVHAAGASTVGEVEADPDGAFARTVTSTEHVLEFVGGMKQPPSIIYISSAAVYGDQGPSPIPTDAPCAPISKYGAHKLRAEKLLLDAAQRHGLDVRILRVFSLYGPYLRKQLLWDALRRITDGEAPLRIDATGHELRDFLFVTDAAELIHRIAFATRSPRVINAGSGIPVSLATLLAKLVQAAELTTSVVFTGVERPGNPLSLVADKASLASISFEPKVTLDEGLRRFATWAVDALNLKIHSAGRK